MKTLFILYYRLDTGGVQTKIIDIINYCAKQKRKLRIILILREKHVLDRIQEIKNPKAIIRYYTDTPWSHLPFFFPVYILGLTFIYSPNAVLAFTFIPALCAIWAKLLFFIKHITVVLSEDWSEPDELSRDLRGNFPYLRRLVFQLFYHQADAICTVNAQISHTLIHAYHIPKSIIMPIQNWFMPTGRAVHTNYTKKIYDLIYVGRLEPVKNILFLLSAFRKIVSKHPQATFCIVGSGTEETKLKNYVKNNRLSDRVLFTGFISDPSSYMAKSKLFVLASKNEGLPMALLEAMASKLPLICSHYPAVHDVVAHGYNGYIYQTAKEYMEYVEKLLRNPKLRTTLGNNGCSMVTRKFNQNNINQYIQLLHI